MCEYMISLLSDRPTLPVTCAFVADIYDTTEGVYSGLDYCACGRRQEGGGGTGPPHPPTLQLNIYLLYTSYI